LKLTQVSLIWMDHFPGVVGEHVFLHGLTIGLEFSF
jgi:hypothetical protein